MNTFTNENIHGRLTLPGMKPLITARRARKLIAQHKMAPKPKNGLTCPYSYYHVLDAILSIVPGEHWTTRDLLLLLEDRPIAYDVYTTGLILNDIIESLMIANKRSYVVRTQRYWDGHRYITDTTTATIEDRIAMENLLEDLERLCLTRTVTKQSPLAGCPSLG